MVSSSRSRAIGVHARTLEVFDLMGLADRFLDRGHLVRRMRMYADGRGLINLDLSRIESRFPFLLDIPQNETQMLLGERVAELGGHIERSKELLTVRQDEFGVMATLRGSGGEIKEIRADYVVGCDGAHSRVRRELGLPFDGHAYAQDWLLADVQLDWSRAEDESHAFFRADGGPMVCFPMRDHYWRLIFPYTGDRQREAPSLLRRGDWFLLSCWRRPGMVGPPRRLLCRDWRRRQPGISTGRVQRNDGIDWRVTALQFAVQVDRARFEREGYLLVDDVFDPMADLDPIVEEYASRLDEVTADWLRRGWIQSTYAELPFAERPAVLGRRCAAEGPAPLPCLWDAALFSTGLEGALRSPFLSPSGLFGSC